jgi:hypothetical protein
LRQVADAPAQEPALTVSVFETSPEGFARYRGLLDAIQLARVIGDAHELEALERDVGDARDVAGKHRDYLKRLVTEARAAVPKQPGPGTDSLRSLAALGRRPNAVSQIAQARPVLPASIAPFRGAEAEQAFGIVYRVGRDGRGEPIFVRPDRDGARGLAWFIVVIDPRNAGRDADGVLEVLAPLLQGTEGGPRSVVPSGERERNN